MIRKNKEKKFYWLRYFFMPIASILSIYIVHQLFYFFTFAKLQSSKETWSIISILKRIYTIITYEIWYGAIGAVILLVKGKWKLFFSLLFAAILVLVSHIVTRRAIPSMDKHSFITIVFLSIIAGIGISSFISSVTIRAAKLLMIIMVFISFIFYIGKSYQKAQVYNTQWHNSSASGEYMKKNVKNGDKVLSETGSPIIMDLYDINFPTNTNTFYWFEYKGNNSIDAYKNAVQDGYFDWIELISNHAGKAKDLGKVHKVVVDNMGYNYQLMYSNRISLVYKRTF